MIVNFKQPIVNDSNEYHTEKRKMGIILSLSETKIKNCWKILNCGILM